MTLYKQISTPLNSEIQHSIIVPTLPIMNKRSCCDLLPNVYISSQHLQHLKTVCFNITFFFVEEIILQRQEAIQRQISRTHSKLYRLSSISFYFMSEGNINTNIITNKTSKQTQIHDTYKNK